MKILKKLKKKEKKEKTSSSNKNQQKLRKRKRRGGGCLLAKIGALNERFNGIISRPIGYFVYSLSFISQSFFQLKIPKFHVF
jgi:hypothetical protein